MEDFVSGRPGLRIILPTDPNVEKLKEKLTKADTPAARIQIKHALITLQQTRVLLMLSNRLIQFVDQVAGNMGDDFTKYLRGVHRDFQQFLGTDRSNPCKEVFETIQKLAPGLTTEELRRIEEFEHRMYDNQQIQNSNAMFLQAISLPTLLATTYFTSVLSAGVRGALSELGQTIRLTAPQADVFHYLIRNVKWMPIFAKLVSVVIQLNKKKGWVSASGIMIKQAREDLYFALRDFTGFRMYDGSEMYRDTLPPVYKTPKIKQPKINPPAGSKTNEPTEGEEEILNEYEEPPVPQKRPPRSFSPSEHTERQFKMPDRLYRQDLEAKYGGFNV
jgi:hypothetical protein